MQLGPQLRKLGPGARGDRLVTEFLCAAQRFGRRPRVSQVRHEKSTVEGPQGIPRLIGAGKRGQGTL